MAQTSEDRPPFAWPWEMPPPPPRRRRWWRRLLRVVGFAGGGLLVLGGIAAFVLYHRLAAGLPDITALQAYQPSLVTQVYARNGELIADFFVERRYLVALEDIPLHMRQATLAVEDARFYAHGGVDPIGVLRALWVNVRAGAVREGASTITQQVARMMFLSQERTLARKLREAMLAYQFERHLSKDDILELYLNLVYYGYDAYGVEAAARVYFGKSATQLTRGEAALLAGLPKAPNTYSPLSDLTRSLRRRRHVLQRMIAVGYLTPQEAGRTQLERVRVVEPRKHINKAPYFVEYIRQYLGARYGPSRLYRGGLQVYTTLDLRLQGAARQALQDGVLAVDKRHGYQGALQRIRLTGDESVDAKTITTVTGTSDDNTAVRQGDVLPGVVLNVDESAVAVAMRGVRRGVLSPQGYNWVREVDMQQDFTARHMLPAADIFQPGDVIQVRVVQVDPTGRAHQLQLEQEPVVQGSLFAMEAGSGHVVAMVGGADFAISQFNRALQATRQPGSAFKPIIYGAALEAGMTPASTVIDAPIIVENSTDNGHWKPENYSQTFYGPITLRTALVHSRNLATIRLLKTIGLPAGLDFARQLGITSPLTPHLSLALGASEVTLAELTAAYGVFANEGFYVPPVFIGKVIDARGNVLEEHFPQARRAIQPEVAYVMTNLLQGVIQEGTGRQVRLLGRPAAGKTGTTDEFRDAWFIGYTPELITGVWVGMDDHTPLGHQENGGRVASPIWLAFMQEATRGRPITDFPRPPGVRFVPIDTTTGSLAAASPGEIRWQAFVDGTQPTQAAPSISSERRILRRLDRGR